MELNRIENFSQFIRVIMSRLDSHFQEQSDYIFCKEGCALCCKNGEYPCSELEYNYLKIGFASVDLKTQEIILEKISSLKKEKENFQGKKFVYECPFLTDNRCSVYPYRMIICRTFGLAYHKQENGKNVIKSPFCMNDGLNYHNVYDKNAKVFSEKMFKSTGLKNPPLAFNIDRDTLIQKFGKEIMELDFGEDKPLLDWL